MAGLVPAIHVFGAAKKDVDARHKAGHDECGSNGAYSGYSTRFTKSAISLINTSGASRCGECRTPGSKRVSTGQ